MTDVRERLSALSTGELVGLVVLVVALLSGAGLWYVRSLPRPVQVRAEPVAETRSPAASTTPAVLLVDVAGWVRSPGVYEFHEGDRVIDAIEAVGGARREAALETLNLAAPLVDGTQVFVTRRGDALPGAASTAGGTAPSSGGALVNVNTASPSELEALPGVGEVIAQRIVDFRTANGPFASVDELLEVSGIGEATLEAMRELVTV
jgi:competence protein ComEA